MITKEVLVETVQLYTSLSLSDAESLVDSFFEQIKENITKGNRVVIRGFGTFEAKKNKIIFKKSPSLNK